MNHESEMEIRACVLVCEYILGSGNPATLNSIDGAVVAANVGEYNP